MGVTRPLLVGAALLVVLLGGSAFAFASVNIGGSSSQTLQIEFPSADGLVAGSDVLESGAKVGSIQDIQPTQSNSALVTISVDAAHWPLHQGLTADIRPKSLLGEKYVDLHDGPSNAPAYNASATLRTSQNANPVELDQFINSLDPTTRTAVRVLLDDLGAGVAGRGEDLNAAIAAGKADLANFAVTGQTLNNRDADLDKILVGLDGVLSKITTDDQLTQISQLITNGQNTLNDIESVKNAFSRQFTDASTTFADLNTALDGAIQNGSLGKTIDAAYGLVPVLGVGPNSEAAMLAFLGQMGITGVDQNGHWIAPGGTPYSAQSADNTPINILIQGLVHGPSTLGGALGGPSGQGGLNPITRVCLDLPVANLPAQNSTCDNPQSALPQTPPVPAGFWGADGAAIFASFLGV